MLGRVLSGGRARLRGACLSAAAAAGPALLLAGCQAAGTTSVSATGRTLTIVLSAPADPASATTVARDVLDAEKLAFAQKASEVSSFKLSLTPASAAKRSDNARTAIQNPSSIAYLGEIAPGDSADSIGITNSQQLLQVSPTDTAQALTQPTSAVSSAPQRYYESLKAYGRTFARVVPTTVQEARALVPEMQALGVKSLYLTDDGSAYGLALAAALRTDGAALNVKTGPASATAFTASGASSLFFASGSATQARALFSAVAAARPGVKLFAGSGLADPGIVRSLGSGKFKLYVSAPGFLPRNLTPSGQAFLAAFRRTYHRVPVPQAIFGYEAMAAVLDVLRQAGNSANSRATVVHDFLAIHNRSSVLGSYSIAAGGDITSLAPFVMERRQAGALMPFAQMG